MLLQQKVARIPELRQASVYPLPGYETILTNNFFSDFSKLDVC